MRSRGILHRISKVAFVLAAAALAAALGYGVAQPQHAQPVYAACGAAYGCVNDPTATSVLDVDHANEAWTPQVEPDAGETWYITAYHRANSAPPGACECAAALQTNVYATVSWTDGSGWSVSCTGCSVNGPITSVTICNTGSCGGETELDNGYSYRLLVNINHTLQWQCPVDQNTYDVYLSSVAYRTTSVDDGNLVDVSATPCTEGAAVSPTSQTWTATDNGAFECALSCSDTGASAAILYR